MASQAPSQDLHDISKPRHQDYKLIMAPDPLVNRTTAPVVFLSGSIERGSTDWRSIVARGLEPHAVTILNPHRSDWDSSWIEDIVCQPYREQVHWELNMMECADIAAVYFATSTDAPITLMELGLMAGKGQENVKVCCPKGYKKRGNVQILCEKYGFEFVESVAELVAAIQKRLRSWPVGDIDV